MYTVNDQYTEMPVYKFNPKSRKPEKVTRAKAVLTSGEGAASNWVLYYCQVVADSGLNSGWNDRMNNCTVHQNKECCTHEIDRKFKKLTVYFFCFEEFLNTADNNLTIQKKGVNFVDIKRTRASYCKSCNYLLQRRIRRS